MGVANVVIDQIVDWTRDWFEVNGRGCNAVIGISGGKDSSISAALLVKALGKDKVIGIQMPDGEQKDISYSDDIIKYLGIKSVQINIGNTINELIREIEDKDILINGQTMINLPARIRMTTLYAISQSSNGRVCNTCNASEDYVGYATMYGDNCGDFSLLQDLKVCEVKQIGYALGLPQKFIEKTPSDGLCGKTDEDNLGVTYEQIDRFLYGLDIDDNAKNIIIDRYTKNHFKYNLHIDHYKCSDRLHELLNPYKE